LGKNRVPQAHLLMIPGAGHGYAVADPIGTHQRIVAWLRGLKQAPASLSQAL